MSLVLRVFLFGCISFLAYGSLPFDRVAAQQAGNWCTALPPVGSGNSACASNPYDACQAQHDGYAPTFPFEGYTDTYRWDVKQCAWAIHAGQGILPAQVGVNCPSGQVAVLPGNCIPQEEVTPVIVPNDNCGSFNNGGGVSMESAYPIDILRGAKLFRATDFSTADGSLKLERLFNSRGYVGTHGYMRAAPLGLGSVWHFAFQHELQFNNSFGDQVEFESADGGSYPFSRNSAGVMTPVNISYGFIQQTDYTLELVGPWPSNIDDILTASTQWKVHDPHGSTWTFQSFYDAVSGKYRIARPIEVVFQGGRQWTFTYGSYNELSSVKDGYGKTISFTWRLRDFSAMGGSITPTEIATAGLPDGTTLKYLYDSSSSNTSSIDYTDRLIGVQHLDASNNILDSTSYLHGDTSVPFNVTGILDNQGTLRWTVQYDANGHAITSTGPNNAFTTSVSYGTADEPATTRTVTNALGKSATYTYNWGTWNVYLQSIDGAASTNCPASTKSWSYSSGFISSTTDEEGRVTSYTRNAIGQPTQIVDGYGTAGARTISLTWDPNFRQPTEVVQPGLTTDFALNALGQLTKVTQTDTTSQTAPYSTAGQTRTWIYTYDSYGSLLTVDGPLAGTVDTVAYTYNPSGYLATVTNEVGQVTTISAVNGRGLPTTLVDANGVTSNLTYDSEGRLATVTVDPTGLAAVTSLSHNAVGDITKVTRPNGAYLQYTYDDARRITEVQDNSGSTVKYTRDNLGNVTGRQITDAGGTLQLSQTAVFDELGRLLKFVGASSQTWVHAHDRTDNLISITDPRSNVFGWTFDSVNRLIGTTDEEGNQVGLSRNGKDEITGYSDPRSLSTSFVRNGFGEVIQRTSPDTGTTVYTYDALGKPIQITDGRGVVTNLTYDNAGRLLSKQYPAGPSENISYSWDATAGGNKGVGRVTKIQDASGAVEWTYNSLGQVTQEKKTTSSVVYTVGYAYDLDGNVTQMTYPSGRIINYYRGSNGLVTTLTEQPNAGSAEALLAKWVTYQPFGPLQSLVYGNGLILWKTFTQDYNLSTFVVEAGSNSVINHSYTYWYNDFDITNVWDNNNTSRTENYVYTPNHWLQNAYGSWGTQTYWQDGVGNRTGDVFDNGTTTTTKVLEYPYNSNLYVGTTEGGTALRVVTNDGAGNIITDLRGSTSYHYHYNNRGRLDQLTIGSTVTAAYAYDGLERMSVRTTENMTPSATTHYIYDRAGRLLVEASAAGTTQREYVWLDDTPLALFANLDTASPQQWYVHPDHLDRPIKMTDANQNVVWDAWYWPYGEIRSITGTASNNLRFPGQYFLVESGLHYNWHRHYDPSIGRYTQADRIRDIVATRPDLDRSWFSALSFISGGASLGSNSTSAGSFNRKMGYELPEFVDGPSVYQYVKGDPVALIDPSGLQSLMCEGFPGGGGSAAGCASGGSYGMGAMYRMGGRNLCESCAIRYQGLGGCPRVEIIEILENYRIGNR